MPSFLEAKLTVAAAQEKMEKFTTVTNEVLEGQDNLPRLFKINVTLMYSAQPAKKVTYFKGTKQFGQANRKLEIEKDHRFILVADTGSSTCYALFTDNSEESRKILRYASYFGPGAQLHVLKPLIIGRLSRGQTILLKTNEPLIPAVSNINVNVSPPFDVETTDYRCFSFVTKELVLDSASIAENVCPGRLCDGQSHHEGVPV